jgi:ABC-type multidrug transport system ATPase subunit
MAREGKPVVALRAARLGHGHRVALDGATAILGSGERVLVVGPNGSGKSTLIATLAGLLPRLGGDVQVLGHDPQRDRRALHRETGHLGHGDPFYAELTGRENLRLHARLRKLPHKDADARLEEVDMTASADRRVATYSHGMRRRLGIAKAMLGAPRLLLLDEPDDGLDLEGRAALLRLLSRDPAMSVVLTTHHPETFEGWAHRVWRLEDGRLHESNGGEP